MSARVPIYARHRQAIEAVAIAARDPSPIAGLTHRFYRYPARFSPSFARAAIEAFTKPGDVVLDPYMGGGTTIVEAMVSGRRGVGSDLNELAVFIANVKVSRLTVRERRALVHWADAIVPAITCREPAPTQIRVPRNMHLPKARWLRKTIALARQSIEAELPTERARNFARCVVLNVGQWALNGRRRIPSVPEFRLRLTQTAHDMLNAAAELAHALPANVIRPVLQNLDVEELPLDKNTAAVGPADLVVTSPPYPGVHVLYHRWQVDGRKETDAPYWISGTNDGQDSSFYNFADRRREAENGYYQKAERAFEAVRKVMRDGAILAQLLAFSEPQRQLPRYLRMLNRTGFVEARASGMRRVWRHVPGRSWHANLKGDLPSSNEVVLLHVTI